MRITRLAPASVAAVAATCLLGMAPAYADDSVQHCWLDVEAATSQCFQTQAEVLAQIDAQDAQRSQSELVSPAATVILGQVFEDANYGGSSYTFTASSGCDTNADVDWQVSSMPSGWNDRVTSFKSFNDCATRIWSDTGYSGSTYGFVVNSTNVGTTMNDQTSSIQWN